MDRSTTRRRPGFCAAPWLESVIRIDGAVLPCCHNNEILGSLDGASLKECWQVPAYQAFRRSIAEGEYPNDACQSCHRAGTATPLARHLLSLSLGLLTSLRPRLTGRKSLRGLLLCLPAVFFLGSLRFSRPLGLGRMTALLFRGALLVIWPRRTPAAVAKLLVCSEAAADYFSLKVLPRHVAPIRQPQLVAVCNLRCRACIGRFTGEIERGIQHDQVWHKRMPTHMVELALGDSDKLLDFFMNGSEFLLYPDWQLVANRLLKLGVRFRLSTNGTLLNRRNVDFLLSRPFLSHLNVSLDGVRNSTIERLRTGVRADLMLNNLAYLFEAASRSPNAPRIGCSFLLLADNFRELPELPHLLGELRGAAPLSLVLNIQRPNVAAVDAYQRFLLKHGIDRENPGEVRQVLELTRLRARHLGIVVKAAAVGSKTDWFDPQVAKLSLAILIQRFWARLL